MKVMHVAYNSLGIGGIQSVIMAIGRSLKDVSFDVLVFSDEKKHHDAEFLSWGGWIYRIVKPGGKSKTWNNAVFYYRQIRQTYKYLRMGGPYDAIHCHNAFDIGFTNFAAWLAGVPVRIAHAHGIGADTRISALMNYYYCFGRLMIRLFSNRYVGCSSAAADFMFGRNNKRAEVIFNGIEQTEFRNEGRAEGAVSPRKLLHIGKFCYAKNQEFLLEMLLELRQSGEAFTLTMVGAGADEVKIRRKIEELHLSDIVNILPPDSDIPGILKQSGLFIFPSRHEGLGIVLVEAQIAGLSCIVSDRVPREVDLGLCRFLSLGKGPQYWAEFVRRSIKNRTLPISIDEEKVGAFDIRKTSRRYFKIYSGKGVRP